MNVSALRIALGIALLLCLGCATINANIDATPSHNADQKFRGQLQVMIADDFKNQTATTHYRLIEDRDGAMLRLEFVNGPPNPALRSGTRVEIHGHLQDGMIRVLTLRVLGD